MNPTHQIIYYGAPGTGKSFKIKEALKTVEEDRVYRVTFHPEYTYSDFIGQLLPKVVDNGGNRQITYEYSKGVFTQAIEKAYQDLSKDVYLILEEMSRGDVATIFGDIFQLLDRENSGPEKGYSRYYINNDLIAQDITSLPNNAVKLPPNMFIIGTVNTSDQNVFVMDTAFKRRFDWEYVSTKPIKNGDGNYFNSVDIKLPSESGVDIETTWIYFFSALNKFIADKKYLELGEDKQIGQFFIGFTSNETQASVKNKIHNKLLQYLWNDIHKASFKRNLNLFSDRINSFSDLYEAFENDENIFSSEFLLCLSETKL